MENNNTTATSNVALAESITKELKVSFTDNELQSIAINAMGRSSEAGTMPAMKLGMAVNTDKNGYILHTYPDKKNNIEGNNSGYTLGFIQWDFGANKNANGLVEAYNEYAKKYNESKNVKDNPDKAMPEYEVEKYALLLQQNRDVNAEGKNDKEKRQHLRVSHPEFYKNINQFITTDEGRKYVISLEKEQVDKLIKAMKEALSSPAIQNMNKEDAVVALAVYAKLVNQAGSGHTTTKAIKELFEKESTTKDNTIEKIKEIHDKEDKKETDKLILSGLDHTLEGTTLYNTLSADQTNLGEIFKDTQKLNQFNISNFNESPDFQLIDTMFRHPDKALDLIEAINNDKNMLIKVNSKIENETYSIGVKDDVLFTLDKDGKGYKREKDGEWEEFDNENERLLYEVNGKLSVTPMTMEKGDKGGSIEELQERINHLIDYENLKIEKIEADGHFGQKTKEAVQAIQKEYGLKDDGVVGKATAALIIDKVTLSQKVEDYIKTKDGLDEMSLYESECWREAQYNNGNLTDEKFIEYIDFADNVIAQKELQEKEHQAYLERRAKEKEQEQEEDNLHYHR